jgi:cell division protein FtsN
MSERDGQTIILSRQSILMVTAVGVSLLTLCYVLGVQVGKQSAALQQTQSKGSGEGLQELPTTLAEQLKSLEGLELEKAQKVVPGDEPIKPAEPKVIKPETPKKGEPPKGDRWTVQLVSTSDSAEADRVAAKAKSAGFTTAIRNDKGAYKVRLTKVSTREDVDTAIAKLKSKGLNAFPVKLD